MCKKSVQHQRRHRGRPSRWRYLYTAIVTLFRVLAWFRLLSWVATHWH